MQKKYITGLAAGLLMFGVSSIVAPSQSKAEDILLFQDDFNDGIIDPFWQSKGTHNEVIENGGMLSIRVPVTDTYQNHVTHDIPYPIDNIRIEMRHYMHAANDFFFPGVQIYETATGRGFAFMWLKSGYGPDYCGNSANYNKVLIKSGSHCYASDLVSSNYYDKWIISHITYNNATGNLYYDLGGDGTIDFTVTLPIEQRLNGNLTFHLEAYGWWTGHYHNIDWIRVDATPVVIDSEPNSAPVLSPISNKTVAEGELLEFVVTATDPDGNSLTYSATNLPPGAAFDAATQTFRWAPSFDQAGNYPNVGFTATDSGSPMELATELITITVGNVNRAPVFSQSTAYTVTEGETLEFSVQAFDPDGDTVSYSTKSLLPVGALFNPFTGTLTWPTEIGQEGNYVIRIYATDNGIPEETSVQEVSVTVGEIPSPAQRADQLITKVLAYHFQPAVENSYLANLKKVPEFVQKGKVTEAIAQLDAFVSKLASDMKKGTISASVGAELTTQANRMIDALQDQQRLARIYDLVLSTKTGKALEGYLNELAGRSAIHLTSLGANGSTSVGLVEQKLLSTPSGTELSCTFSDVFILLNVDQLGGDETVASTLVHELIHYRDAVQKSNAMDFMNVGWTEINAFAGKYSHIIERMALSKAASKDFASVLLPTEEMKTCWQYTNGADLNQDGMFNDGDRAIVIDAVKGISDKYTDDVLNNTVQFVCTSGY